MVGLVLLVGAVAAAIYAVPAITTSKRERAAQERRDLAASQAAERRRIETEQRPRRGRLTAGAAVPQLESAITADARARVASGEVETRALRTDCEVIHENARRTMLSCTAVTSDIPKSATSRGGVVGYPYRVRVERPGGSYGFCKTVGQAGEGAFGSTRHLKVPLPAACGG